MIDKEVHVRAVVFDIPLEDGRVGGLEHNGIDPECADDFGRNIRPPRPDFLRDALGLDHYDVRARIKAGLGALDDPLSIPRSLSRQLRRRSCSACAKLDPELRLRLKSF